MHSLYLIIPEVMAKDNTKEAMQAARTVMPYVKDFGKGLIAPVQKLWGGMQKTFGRGQQLMGGLTNNTALYDRGINTFNAGVAQRAPYGLRHMLNNGPVASRLGRAVGGTTLGAGLAMAPYTLGTYAGAGSWDPETLKQHGMAMAQDQMNNRLSEYGNMSMWDRMRYAHNPDLFSENILGSSPQAADILNSPAPTSAPGLGSFISPLVTGLFANDPIRDAIRHGALNAGMPKGASFDKQSMSLFRGAGSAIASRFPGIASTFKNVIRPSWTTGGLARRSDAVGKATTDLTHSLRNVFHTPRERLISNSVYNFAKSPFKSTATAAGVGLAGASPFMGYNAGKANALNQTTNDAQGMADIGLAQHWNSMNPMMRYMSSIAPGMAQNYANNQFLNSMYSGRL